eukprot:8773855-Alexandrium_andersonii.AAC.1
MGRPSPASNCSTWPLLGGESGGGGALTPCAVEVEAGATVLWAPVLEATVRRRTRPARGGSTWLSRPFCLAQ